MQYAPAVKTLARIDRQAGKLVKRGTYLAHQCRTAGEQRFHRRWQYVDLGQRM